MRLLKKSNTRNLYNSLTEGTIVGTIVHTGFSDEQTKDILKSVIGQLSDGMWENTPSMKRFWMYMDFDTDGNEAVMKFNTDTWKSGFKDKDINQLKKWLAGKIKQIVKEEDLDWSRDNTEICRYLDRGSGVTVRDAYRVYDRLLGRIDRIKESMIPNSKDDNFSDTVKRDFKLFLLDKYDDEQYSDVTEEDVNEYFTGMFYDIWDNDDMESANKAEEIIRNEYGLTESINESTKLEEAKKPKKEDKRVVMQQGNVTCIKENDSYLVFENEADNEVEHDSEESAMQDFLERVGVNPDGRDLEDKTHKSETIGKLDEADKNEERIIGTYEVYKNGQKCNINVKQFNNDKSKMYAVDNPFKGFEWGTNFYKTEDAVKKFLSKHNATKKS